MGQNLFSCGRMGASVLMIFSFTPRWHWGNEWCLQSVNARLGRLIPTCLGAKFFQTISAESGASGENIALVFVTAIAKH